LVLVLDENGNKHFQLAGHPTKRADGPDIQIILSALAISWRELILAQFFPAVPARPAVLQTHGRQRLGRSHRAIMTERLGARRAILAVVLAGALVMYGGVSLFVAYFVLAPMAQALFQPADIPRRLMPAAIALGTSPFTMTAFPGTPVVQNAIPMPFFGTTPFAARGLGNIASAIMLGFGLWWLTVPKPPLRGQVRAMVVVLVSPRARSPIIGSSRSGRPMSCARVDRKKP
jgi:hypothetical protein